MAVALPKLEAADALGPHGLSPQQLDAAKRERAPLSRANLRLCCVTRSQAKQLAGLELALLRSGPQPGSGGKPGAPLSILAGCFCRFLTNKQHRLGRIVGACEKRGQLNLLMEGHDRPMPLSCLSNSDVLGDEVQWEALGRAELQQMQAAMVGASQGLAREEFAAACCRVSTAWLWAQHPEAFAAECRRAPAGVTAALEDPAAIEALLPCVEGVAMEQQQQQQQQQQAPLSPLSQQQQRQQAPLSPPSQQQQQQQQQPPQWQHAPFSPPPQQQQQQQQWQRQAPEDLPPAKRLRPGSAASGSAGALQPPVPPPGQALLPRAHGSWPFGMPPEVALAILAQQAAPQQLQPPSATLPLAPKIVPKQGRNPTKGAAQWMPRGGKLESLLLRASLQLLKGDRDRTCQLGDLGNKMRALNSQWREMCPGRSLHDCTVVLEARGLIRLEQRGSDKFSSNIFFRLP